MATSCEDRHCGGYISDMAGLGVGRHRLDEKLDGWNQRGCRRRKEEIERFMIEKRRRGDLGASDDEDESKSEAWAMMENKKKNGRSGVFRSNVK